MAGFGFSRGQVRISVLPPCGISVTAWCKNWRTGHSHGCWRLLEPDLLGSDSKPKKQLKNVIYIYYILYIIYIIYIIRSSWESAMMIMMWPWWASFISLAAWHGTWFVDWPAKPAQVVEKWFSSGVAQVIFGVWKQGTWLVWLVGGFKHLLFSIS